MHFYTKSAHIELYVKDHQPIVAVTQLKETTTFSFHADDFLDLLNKGVAFMETFEGVHIKMVFNRDVGHLRTDKGNAINTYISDKVMRDKIKSELCNIIDFTCQEDGGGLMPW